MTGVPEGSPHSALLARNRPQKSGSIYNSRPNSIRIGRDHESLGLGAGEKGPASLKRLQRRAGRVGVDLKKTIVSAAGSPLRTRD